MWPGTGQAAEDIPQAIRQGGLVEIASLYENREDILAGQGTSLVSFSERLLWPYRALAPE